MDILRRLLGRLSPAQESGVGRQAGEESSSAMSPDVAPDEELDDETMDMLLTHAAAFAASGSRAKEARQAYECGGAHMMRNEDDQALTFFRQAVEYDPGNAEYRNSVGRVLIKLQRYAEAQATFQEVIKADPTNLGALIGVGNCLAGMRDFAGSIGYYDRVLALDGGNANAWFFKAVSEADLGRNREALRSMDRCLGCENPPPWASDLRRKIALRI